MLRTGWKFLYLQSTIQVGVAVLDDASRLLIDYNMEVGGCVDLRHLAVRAHSAPGNLGLDSLAHKYLAVQLDKVGLSI